MAAAKKKGPAMEAARARNTFKRPSGVRRNHPASAVGAIGEAGGTLAAMKAAKRWMLGKIIQGRKTPLYADGLPRSGSLDSAADQARLVTYTVAVAAAKRLGCELGFALGPDGKGGCWQGLDFDHISQHPEHADVRAAAIGYVEISLSGDGEHVIGYGMDFAALAANESGIEAYAHGRFFIFTGNVLRDGPLTDLSSYVIKTLKPLHARGKKGGQGEGRVGEGSRNTSAFNEACRWRRANPAGDLSAHMNAWNADNCVPPLPDAEIASVVASALRPSESPIDSATWRVPPPIVEKLDPAPTLHRTMLPPTLRTPIEDMVARNGMVAPESIAVSILIVLCALLAGKAFVLQKAKDTYAVAVNLWGMIVLEIGKRKSAALRVGPDQLRRRQKLDHERYLQRIEEYEKDVAIFALKKAALESAVKKESLAGGSGRADQLRALEPPVEPVFAELITGDATPEALEVNVAKRAGFMSFHDEFSRLFGSFVRMGREQLRSMWLGFWNGTTVDSTTRMTRGVPPFLQNGVLFGGVQPKVLRNFFSAETYQGLGSDGFIQRFQLAVMPDPRPWSLGEDELPDPTIHAALAEVIDRFAEFDAVAVGACPADDYVSRPYFRFSKDAQTLYFEWLTELHTERIPAEQNPLVRQHLEKYDKLFCALALVFHIVERGRGPISYDAALRAAAWCEFLEMHARRIYGLIESADVTAAQLVTRRLGEGKLADGFTAYQLVEKDWAGIHSMREAAPVLALLVENGWLQSAASEEGTSGRPTTRYYINPLIPKEAA